MLIRVYNSLENEEIDYETDVTVHIDGRTYTVPAGTQITASIRRWEDSLKLRKMKHHIVCFAMSIR